MRPYYVLITLLLLVLSACAPRSEPGNTAPTPDVSLTLTTTPQPDVPPTMTPYIPPPTVTPDPQSVTLGDGVLTPLVPVPADATQIKVGHQERWFTYLLLRPLEGPTGPAPIPSTLTVLDSATGATWEVTRSCNDFVCEFAWLSTGQLLWLEDGNVFIADADGQNKRDLNAPEGISEIFGVSANDIAVLRGGDGTHLWRLYLPDGTFDAVPEAQPHEQPIPDFVTQNDLLYFTADGTMAGLAYQTTFYPEPDLKIIALSLEAGSAPTLLAAPTGFQYPGRGGPAPLPPVPLPGTPYWLPPETLWLGENGVTMPVSLVIDGVTGEFVNLERLTGLGDQGFRIMYTQLSPDRQYVAMYVEDTPTDQPPITMVQRFYVAPSNNLAGGTILTGTVEGWASNPAAIILKEYTGELTLPLFHISLTDGTKTPIVETVPQFEFGAVASTSTALFVQPTVRQAETLVLAGDGSIVGRQNIPPRHIVYDGGEEYRSELVGAFGTRLYIFGGNPNNVEDSTQHVLWRWDASE
jgi:hypothetical protein